MAEGHLILLDDAAIGHEDIRVSGDACLIIERKDIDVMSPTEQLDRDRVAETSCEYAYHPPKELASHDPEVLRAALRRESIERRRAECSAGMQTEVVKLALDLLVREPDIEGFFGGLAKTVVEESESNTCAVWLLDESNQQLRVVARLREGSVVHAAQRRGAEMRRGWLGQDGVSVREHGGASVRVRTRLVADDRILRQRTNASPMRFGRSRPRWTGNRRWPRRCGSATRTLGWMTVCSDRRSDPESNWGRVVLIEAIARQAALALHHSRLVEHNRVEERRKAILEERNRLARDIHDNLAQGFAAILMQLQAAQREACTLSPAVATSITTAVDLARTHLTEARRSVGTLRPNVGSGEDMATALKRLTELNRRTTTVPIDLVVDELPRFGDGVEREIVAIAQEALTNAVRHSRAGKITIRAATVQSVGLAALGGR